MDYFPQAGSLPIGELRNLYNRCNGSQFHVNKMRTHVAAPLGAEAGRRPIYSQAARSRAAASLPDHTPDRGAHEPFALLRKFRSRHAGAVPQGVDSQLPCWFSLLTPNMGLRQS